MPAIPRTRDLQRDPHTDRRRKPPGQVRRALKRLDRRLDIRFHRDKRRWQVLEWIHRYQTWSHVFFWEGPGQSFRSLSGAAPLLEKLRRADCEKYGQRKGMGCLLEGEWDATRRTHLRNFMKERDDEYRLYVKDYLARMSRQKVVVPMRPHQEMGPQRARGTKNYDLNGRAAAISKRIAEGADQDPRAAQWLQSERLRRLRG